MKKCLVETEIKVTFVISAENEDAVTEKARTLVAGIVTSVREGSDHTSVAFDVPNKYHYKVTEIPSE